MSIPLLVVAGYLVVVTLVGSLVARRGGGAREWTVAGGRLGTLMLTVGLAGTRIGGAGTYGVAGDVITGGVWYLWWYGAATFLALAGDQQPVRGRSPHPAGRVEQQFPTLRREPQHRGAPLARHTRMVSAEQTIFHDAARPSHVVLPVIPG